MKEIFQKAVKARKLKMKNLSSKEQLDFKTLGTIKSSGESIYWRETKIDKADHKNRLIY